MVTSLPQRPNYFLNIRFIPIKVLVSDLWYYHKPYKSNCLFSVSPQESNIELFNLNYTQHQPMCMLIQKVGRLQGNDKCHLLKKKNFYKK